MNSGDKIDFTTEWIVVIAVAVVAFLLGWAGLWPLSLCCFLAGAALFVALLAHELDPARSSPSEDQEFSRGSRPKVSTAVLAKKDNLPQSK